MPQYQGIWNLAQQAQALVSQQWGTDPLFDYTTLLIQGDNVANGAQNNTFLDSSTANGGLGFPITRNGGNPGMSQGTFSPFSATGWSVYAGGTNAWLTFPTGTLNYYGTKTTIEMWIYPTALTTGTTYGLLVNADSSGAACQISFTIYADTSSTFQLGIYSVAPNASLISTIKGNINQWNHVVVQLDCVTPSTTNQVVFGINGIVETSTYNFSNLTSSGFSANPLSVGGNGYFHSYFAGYISNMRFVQGGNYVYGTSNYTVPTAPLSSITGTQFLVCQAYRFIDANTQATPRTITVGAGVPSAQAFSPFAPQFQYTPTVTGGSGYFDGTGDYLTGNTNLWATNTSTFTVDGWIYPSAATNALNLIVGDCTPTAATLFVAVYINNSRQIAIQWFDGATKTCTSTGTVNLNSWNYFAVVVNSNAISIFVNSTTSGQTGTTTLTNRTGVNNFSIGQFNNTSTFSGYISDLRVSTTARTISSIPSAPLASDVNTRLLLNFTNAGIYDGTMKNNSETVGNAQIRASTSKYGSGSMFFDGTDDRVSIPTNPNLDFGSGDFTIECWACNTAWDVTQNQLFERGQFTVAKAYRGWMTATAIVFEINLSATATGTYTTVTATITNNLNQWYHVAFVRLNNVFTIYRDGIALTSTTNTATAFTTTEALSVGGAADANNNIMMNGYIDDFRITKGVARYNRNFTPPQVALPRQ